MIRDEIQFSTLAFQKVVLQFNFLFGPQRLEEYLREEIINILLRELLNEGLFSMVIVKNLSIWP